jgi:hypothetical protein
MLPAKTTFNPDQFGYYTVGNDFRTYSKLEAMQTMQRTGIHLEWNFNKEIFGSYDWKTEPTETLPELYRQRAQQIRDSYDYVVIFYSGGADSWNILNTFLSNGIRVDEIAHCWSLAGDRTHSSYFNEEVYHVAIPNSQKIKEQYPDINHRIIDISQTVNDMYLQGSNKFDFIYYTNSLISPNGLARSYLRETVPEYRNMIASGQRVAFIWGTEKPRLHLRDGRYACQFLDMFDNTVSSRLQSIALDKGYYDELFYWSPAAVPIIIKQCHLMRRFLSVADPRHVWLEDQTGPYGKTKQGNRWLTNHGLHSIIYPGWDVNTFTNGKNNQSVIGPRDRWFWSQDPETNPGLKIFNAGVQKIFSSIDRYWYNVETDWRRGFKNCINEYFIE